jgi:hypothetical protein
MSLWISETYATLWRSDNKGKYIDASVSTSEKKRDTEEYKNSNWNTRFVGSAVDKIDGLPERTRFKILSGKISNETKETDNGKKTYTNLVVFDVELLEENSTPTKRPISNKKNVKPTENQIGDNSDNQSDELPF